MTWNGSGTYNRIHNWTADAGASIDIEATRMDAEDDSIAGGINNCLTKDGQNQATSDINLGSNKLINVQAGTAETDAATIGGTETLTNKTIASPTLNTPTINTPTIQGGTIGTTTPATQINVDDLRLDGGTISNTATDQGLTFTPNGTGDSTFSTGNVIISSGTISLSGTDVDATAAELNLLDASAQAISNYTTGVRRYFHNNGANSTVFDLDANVTENTFESVGPTGSGATNIWTAMDDIPSGAKAAYLLIIMEGVGTDSAKLLEVFGRRGDSATAAFNGQILAGITLTSTTAGLETTAWVPLDSSNIFDILWFASGDTTSRNIQIYLKGFEI